MGLWSGSCFMPRYKLLPSFALQQIDTERKNLELMPFTVCFYIILKALYTESAQLGSQWMDFMRYSMENMLLKGKIPTIIPHQYKYFHIWFSIFWNICTICYVDFSALSTIQLREDFVKKLHDTAWSSLYQGPISKDWSKAQWSHLKDSLTFYFLTDKKSSPYTHIYQGRIFIRPLREQAKNRTIILLIILGQVLPS